MTLCSRCYNRIISSGSIEIKPRGRKRTAAQADLSLKQGDDDSDDDTSLTWHPPTPCAGQGQRHQLNRPIRACTSKGMCLQSAAPTAAEVCGSSSARPTFDSLRLLSEYNNEDDDCEVHVLEHGKPVEQEQFQQQMDAADERGQQGASAPSATAEPATKPDGMLCSFKGCLKPLGVPGAPGFQKIFHITTSTKAGEQDWSNLLGMTLCKACYYRFSRSGCLEGGPSRVDPISRTRGSHERVLNQGRLPVRGRPGLRSSAFASSAAGTSVFGEAAAHCTLSLIHI